MSAPSMSPFEFFFSFYGLLLGLSVIELVAGLARTLHAGRPLRMGWHTLLLATFVLGDITSFWAFAWLDLRDVEVSYAALVGALVIAGLYYIAASLVFPREIPEHGRLDVHFWRHRRTILLAVAACNLPIYLMAIVRNVHEGQPVLLLTAFGIYYLIIATAAFGRRRRVVLAALVLANLVYVIQLVGSIRGILI